MLSRVGLQLKQQKSSHYVFHCKRRISYLGFLQVGFVNIAKFCYTYLTGVIICEQEKFQEHSHSESSRAKQGHTESNRVIQSHTDSYKVIQSQTESYRVIQPHTKSYRVLQNQTESYRVKRVITSWG